MNGKFKGLDKIFGKNLEDLINNVDRNAILNNVFQVELKKIFPNPNQPRKIFNQKTIDELAKSIKENGLISPILIRKSKNEDRYYIIAGERRVRAFKKNNEKFIPAIIKNVSENQSAELALIENVVREGLNKLEESLAAKKMLVDNNWTHEELARKLNKSRSYITNLLRIEKLDSKILDALNSGQVTLGKVKMLINLEVDKQLEIFDKILENNLSSRDVETLVSNLNKNSKKEFHYSKFLNKNIFLSSDKIVITFEDKESLEKIKQLLEIN